MKLAFSTLGCPHWDLDRITEAARSYHYQGIELRAIGGELDLLNRPELQSERLDATRRWLAAQGLSVCCVDSSCTFDSPDPHEQHQQVELALKHCELAAALGANLIRVFPDRLREGLSRDKTRDNIASCLSEVGRRASTGVRVGLETHGDFASGAAAAEIVRLAGHRNVALIWDVANALAAGDSIEESAREVAPYLAHVHLRDARPVDENEHWLPVLAGRGKVSFAATVDVLDRLGYDGYISFEWEKYWYPEIEEPEIALPDFIEAMKLVLGRSYHTSPVPAS